MPSGTPEVRAEAEVERKTAAAANGEEDAAICWKPKRGNSFKAHHDLARRLNSAEEEKAAAAASAGCGNGLAGNSNAKLGCESGEREDDGIAED